MDKYKLADIIINNFQQAKKSDLNIHHIATIKDVIFINDLKKLNKIEKFYKQTSYLRKHIISKPEYYQKMKCILLETIEFDDMNKLKSDFQILEKVGFNAFGPYDSFNPKVKELLRGELKYLINKKFNAKYIDYGENASTILTKDSNTSLHTGILYMIEYMNMSKFMSYDVFMNLDPKFTDVKIYHTNTNINNIYLLANDTETNYDVNQLDFMCQIGDTVINTMNQLFNKTINILNIDLILFLSKALKKFPEHQHPLTENEVNSADTYTFQHPLIRLYRQEEMFKVFIHELIHATQCDKLVDSNIQYIFNVNSSLRTIETITETFAEFINCVIYSHIHKMDLDKVLEQEINFGFKQTARILNHFNFTSVNDFLNRTNNQIIQTTSAFEYHILKTVLLFKFDEYLKKVIEHGNLTDLIITTMKSKEYQYSVNTNIKQNHNDTFRMTIVELKTIKQNGGSNRAMYEYYKNKYLILKKNYSNLYI